MIAQQKKVDIAVTAILLLSCSMTGETIWKLPSRLKRFKLN